MQLPGPTPLHPAIVQALSRSQTIDITTTGRRTGLARRIEIVLHNFGGRMYISGMPRPGRTRAWIHNLDADPRLIVHLKGTLAADVPATARIITDETERRAVFARIVQVWLGQDIETMTRHSPLIEVTVAGLGSATAA